MKPYGWGTVAGGFVLLSGLQAGPALAEGLRKTIGLAGERIAAAEARLRSGQGAPDLQGRIDRDYALVAEARDLNRPRRHHAPCLRKAREAQELVQTR